MTKTLVQLVGPLAGVVFALWGVLASGEHCRNRLREHERYRIAFADIDCATPQGLTRVEFLDEVQYLASWPDNVRLLEDAVAARLAKAFALHPWVEEVRRVEVTSGRRVRVELTFRTPVLMVPTRAKGDGPAGEIDYRSVDSHGVLLPRSDADAAPGPRLLAELPCPRCRAGIVWDDQRVQTAARTASYLRPFAEQVGIENYDFAGGDLVLHSRTGRVVWGRAPGEERSDEALAEVKLRRLLDGDVVPEHRERDLRSPPDAHTRLVKSK
jgi:hypothetical protein